MKRTLSEQKVLKQLKIDNFRQLSKDTVMKFASSINQMDPEVAKKALEQFPEFATVVKEAITEYKEAAIDVVSRGNEDHKELISMIKSEYQILLKMLNNDNLTVDEKIKILDRVDELQNKVSKENKEMRNYRLKVLGGLFTTIGVGILVLASTLGGNTEITKNEDSEDEI